MNSSTIPSSETRFLESTRRIAAAARTILSEERRQACSPVDLLRDKGALASIVTAYDLRIVQGKVPVPEPVRAAVRVLREWTLFNESTRHAMLAEIVNDQAFASR